MRAPRVERRLQAKDVEAPLAREDWQADAYAYAAAVGEVNYALSLKANSLARCRLRPERREPGTNEWVETDDARVQRVTSSLHPPLGGQSELLRKALIHLDTAGETWFHGAPVQDLLGNEAGLVWEFLSVLEITVKKDGQVVRDAWGASKGKAPVPDEAFVVRLHRPAADYSQRAASPMQGVLTILQQIVLLTQVIDAIARSRLTAGILYAPWEVSFGPSDEFENPGADPSTAESVDEFEAELRQHLTAPITDHTAESSLIPLLMRGPALIDGHPAKELIGVIDLARELDDRFQGLRAEALDRLAAGLDLPVEMMQGKGSLSGLGGGNVAESVDDDMIEKHIIPPGELIAEFLTAVYLRPMLIKFEAMTPADADWFRYSLDPSALRADPDRSAAATAGHNMLLLSDQAWLDANGFDEADAINAEEQYRRRLLGLAVNAPTILAPFLLPLVFPDRPEIAAVCEEAKKAFGGGGAGMPSQVPNTPDDQRAPDALPSTAVDALVAALDGGGRG